METTTQSTPHLSRAQKHADKAGMSLTEWQSATKFDGTDWGWVFMSIGMAIGAGIVFYLLKSV
ncbi:hypothetical protein ACEN4A_03000 [Latilactobacillus sakei]|uniref:hypothetical protein n=1 Tax=Latilactobacillus sakei TaxID=1599 RepID=UPI003888C237